MLRVVAKNYINAEQVPMALEICRELVEATNKEDGCLFYAAFQEKEDPTIITFLENWAGKDYLDAHMKSEHFTRLVPRMGALAVKPGEVYIYDTPIV